MVFNSKVISRPSTRKLVLVIDPLAIKRKNEDKKYNKAKFVVSAFASFY